MLNYRDIQPVSVPKMSQNLAVMLFGHCSGFAFQNIIYIKPSEGTKRLNLNRVRFIRNNILAFFAMDVVMTIVVVECPEEITQLCLLSLRKRLIGRSVRCLCFMYILWRHLMMTCMKQGHQIKQVKTIGSRKPDREEHTADPIADAFVRMTLIVRFRRRTVTESSNVSNLPDAVLKRRGKHSWHALLCQPIEVTGNSN